MYGKAQQAEERKGAAAALVGDDIIQENSTEHAAMDVDSQTPSAKEMR